ncbi:MAG TPA: molybdopterin-binding oxidoreductase, partial [Actinomycetota bacterium]|nr:molybdopterin-binding oxidoreductase [Actinomycetota bacterium]
GTAEVSGVAWGGRNGLASVEIRVAGGPWRKVDQLIPADEPNGLSRWRAALHLAPGRHRIEVRAYDGAGAYQPERAEWNPLGYANNSSHDIRIRTVALAA